MDHLSLEFIGRQNIDLFVSQLELESDARLRSSLQRRLVDEANRFGRLSARVEVMDQYIRRAGTRIIEQKRCVEKLQRVGADVALAKQALANFEELHQVLLGCRQTVLGTHNPGHG